MEINQVELEKMIESGTKVIVDAYAPWCGPCMMMKPTFEKVANNNTSSTKMFTLNVDKYGDFAAKHGVRSIPTLLVFEGGVLKTSKVGAQSEAQLKSLL